MRDEKFFLHPVYEWQKRYEALRASFVDRLPAAVVAERFGYSASYVNLLRHQFVHGKIDFSEPVPEGKIKRRKVDSLTRTKICSWREHRLSAGEIAQLLSEDGIEISVRTVERILAEEGYPKLPRRTRLKIGLTVQGAKVPETSQAVSMEEWDNRKHECQDAGIFIFAPFIQRLNIPQIVQNAGLPGSKMIPAISYFLSFLAVKLVGTQRYSHMGDHAFDSGIGLFAGLNVLPKCTAMSTYSYGLDPPELLRLQRNFIKQVDKLGLIDKAVINLDFHTVPHFGEESVLEKHWAGARNKRMKGALTLFAQDAASKLILYTAADIQKDEADDQILVFLKYWKGIQRRIPPTFVFDSKFTTYANLSALNQMGIKFITLRRRGKRLIDNIDKIDHWNRIHIPHAKRKYPNPLVHESHIEVKGYEGFLRQVIIRGNGREKPTFLISNDFDSPLELIVSNYSRRWRVENAIAEAVKFFNLNALSSPILIKVHFDVIMTMIADTLYCMLAKKLRGFEECDAPKIYRHFIKGKGKIVAKEGNLTVIFPKRAHNPILRAVPWHRMPSVLNWLDGANLHLVFQ
ncbi:MAG: transposase [Deltaproteobacteria bacterium]|nr:transposase [Deltaproteobacteria bacterium]